MQIALLGARVPELPAEVDLRRADVGAVLDDVAPGSVDLVVADPPWDLYAQRPGTAAPDGVYSLLDEAAIGEHLRRAVEALRPGGRLALWACWPLLVEALGKRQRVPWLHVPGLAWKSGGAWGKLGPPGVGFHWRGHSEPVLVGVREGGAAGRAAVMLRSGHTSTAEAHSRKPVAWIADWVRAWVPPGGLVLDLYAGLGSVAEAVVEAGEGRRYVGAEVDVERHAAALANVRRRSVGA